MLLQTDWEDLTERWRVPGANAEDEPTPPTPTQAAQAALMGRASRVLCGAQTSFAEERRLKQEADAAEERIRIAEAQATAAKAATENSGALVPVNTSINKKIKLSTTIDQSNDQECEILDETRLKKAYTAYHAIFKALPEQGEEPTIEQLSSILTLLTQGSPPYVDFSVFGPHGYRIMRKLKLTGMQMFPGGEFRNIELSGPPTFYLWETIYTVLRVALIMLEAVGIANLDKYLKRHRTYAERYGAVVWHLQYQSDVRMRSERMVRIRRMGETEYAKATAAGKLHDFNPDMPWDWVWGYAAEDDQWWRNEFEERALLVLSRTSTLSRMIDGDAPVEAGSEAATKRPKKGSPGEPPDWMAPTAYQGGDLKHKLMDRRHNVQNGLFTTNRRGTGLCDAFNKGECKETGPDNSCKSNLLMVHQCNKCLGGHPGVHCDKNPSVPGNVSGSLPGGKGRGKTSKGKGKGKGKKGKRGYWG